MHLKANPVLLQKPPRPRRGLESECAAPSQHDSVYRRRNVHWVQHPNLGRAAGPATDVHTTARSGLAKDHGAPRDPFKIRCMPHPNSSD